MTSYHVAAAISVAPGYGRGYRSERGFTLIELMIVVVIVAVLAMIALPAYQEQMRKARRSQAKADLTELAQQLERAYTTNRSYAAAAFNLSTSGITQSPRSGEPFVAYGITIEQATTTYTLTATPAPGTAQTSDHCGILTLDQAGRKTHTGDSDTCDWGTGP
jgi:type IV pilus assembly protein PilE